MANEQNIGKVFSYFSKVSVAAIKLNGDLNVGDKIHIKGSTTDFVQKVRSIQIEREEVAKAVSGQSVGTKVKDRVRPNDEVFRVVE